MNPGDIVVIVLIAAAVGFAVWRIVKRKRSGGCSCGDCGGNCGSCGSGCPKCKK